MCVFVCLHRFFFSLTVLDSTFVLSRPSLSSSSSSSLNSAAAFSMNLKTSSTALVSETSAFLLTNTGSNSYCRGKTILVCVYVTMLLYYSSIVTLWCCCPLLINLYHSPEAQYWGVLRSSHFPLR